MRIPVIVAAHCLALSSCTSQDPPARASSPLAATAIDMTWGDTRNPANSGGFGMQVTLRTDGSLSCEYGFTDDYMHFTGATSSTGQVSPATLRSLERVFTDAEFLALPDQMPAGTPDAVRGKYQLTTSFNGDGKQIRLVPDGIASEAENDRFMRSVDTVFNICPTRPLTPILD